MTPVWTLGLPVRDDAGEQPTFRTDFVFTDRESKGRYVWLRYQSILRGAVLDVGADERHLAKHLPSEVSYTGIGLGGSPDIELDLELGRLPFEDDRFDCVLCLDVLEHLEGAHAMFDELCRVSRRHVIISLPNPHWEFYRMLREGNYCEGRHLKFYGLPPEPPEDRHRWFFSVEEAKAFISHRAKSQGMEILELHANPNADRRYGLRGRIEAIAQRILFGRTFDPANIWAGPLWAVLEKRP